MAKCVYMSNNCQFYVSDDCRLLINGGMSINDGNGKVSLPTCELYGKRIVKMRRIAG
jgi:hypothetical protein